MRTNQVGEVISELKWDDTPLYEKNRSTLVSNIPQQEVIMPRKLKWAHEVIAEAKELKSDISPLLAEWLDKHPQFDFRSKIG